MRIPKKVGRRPKGRCCEAFPDVKVCDIDRNVTQALIDLKVYKIRRWNRPDRLVAL